MSRLIARIRMESAGIGVSICATMTFYLFSNSVTVLDSWICLVLLIVECMILIRRPRRLFQRRLNDYFVVVHYPFCKWHQIYQLPAHRHHSIKHGEQNCDAIFHSLKLQMKSMSSPSSFPAGYYRTITHDTMRGRIEHCEKLGYLTIPTCRPVYRKSLEQIQKTVLNKNCKRCPSAGLCYFRHYATQSRQFYYIEFQVHNQ